MKYMLRCIYIEAFKHHKSNYHSKFTYFTMLFWPVLQLITTYYTYMSFKDAEPSALIKSLLGEEKLFLFIFTGYLGYMFFKCFIQTAWMFSRERVQGTLELIFLTPANKIAIILGNAVSSLFESVWMFTIFCIGSLFVFSDIFIESWYMIIVALFSLIIPSICWGMFLNTLFLFSRDTRTLFSILDEPMEIFAGVKLPYEILPFWTKAIGSFFPLTWSLIIIRKIFMQNATISDISTELYYSGIICILLLILTIVLLRQAEIYIKKNGNAELF